MKIRPRETLLFLGSAGLILFFSLFLDHQSPKHDLSLAIPTTSIPDVADSVVALQPEALMFTEGIESMPTPVKLTAKGSENYFIISSEEGIALYNREDILMYPFVYTGEGSAELSEPTCVLLISGLVFVADPQCQRVQLYDLVNLQYLGGWKDPLLNKTVRLRTIEAGVIADLSDSTTFLFRLSKAPAVATK